MLWGSPGHTQRPGWGVPNKGPPIIKMIPALGCGVGLWSHHSFENMVPINLKSALASRSVPSFCARLDNYNPLGKQAPVPSHTCNARSCCCCRQPERHSPRVRCVFPDLITHPIRALTTSPENNHLSSAWTTCCKIWSREKDCMIT